MKDHNPGKAFASPLADENEILMPFFYFNLVTVWYVKFYFINGSWRDGDEALFASFSFYFDKTFIKIKVGQLEGDKLRYAKSATVK